MSSSIADMAQILCPLAAQMLGWRPQEFWDATPAELALCLAQPQTGAPSMNRATFEQLMKDDRHG